MREGGREGGRERGRGRGRGGGRGRRGGESEREREKDNNGCKKIQEYNYRKQESIYKLTFALKALFCIFNFVR